MQSDYSEYLVIAREAAHLAGAFLREQFHAVKQVDESLQHDIKLRLDKDCQTLITRHLLEACPQSSILGEEGNSGDADAEFQWVVDPIDGTFNFLRGIPSVCVSIGLMCGMRPIAGAVYDFTRNELFSGGREFGLFLNGAKIEPKWAKSMEQAVVMTGFPSTTDYSDENMRLFVKRMQKFKKVRMCGSAAIACSWVASGRADCYDERGINLWDIAAGLSLIEGAGGVWKCESAGIEGRPLAFNLQMACREEFYIKD